MRTSDDRKIKAFIAMPFAKDGDKLLRSFQKACRQANVEPIRADSSNKPGPIINQIFEEIERADILIAEIGTSNPNVYYEVGLAHCVRKPSILIARKDKIDGLPFDLRHNRVIVFDDRDLPTLVNRLTTSISGVKETITGTPPTLEDAIRDTSDGCFDLNQLVVEVGHGFGFHAPQLVSEKFLHHENSYMVEIKDAYSDDRARFIYDINGNIRDKRLIEHR